MLSIRLLGAPAIVYAAHPVTITRRKSRALLYYLAAQPAPVTRTQLLAFFWPDADRASAQQNLRSTLYGLRKIFGDLLCVQDDTLALASTTLVDARMFAAQLALVTLSLAQLETTLALYQGDFLHGFILPDLPEFDDWAAVAREHYRRLMVNGLARLSQCYETQHAYRPALTTLDRALALEPLQEDLVRAALRLQTWAGDRAGAIRRYEHFRQLLGDELGVPPMEETQTLYTAIITDKLLPAPPPLPPPLRAMPEVRSTEPALPFIGRHRELAYLMTLPQAQQLVLVEGEAGIGKSRLLAEFTHSQRATHFPPLVLFGQARELEVTLPYQPVIEALRSLFVQPMWPELEQKLQLSPLWRAEVARLLPELALQDDAPTAWTTDVNELRLWEGIGQFLLALAHQQPVLLMLDDLHWADSTTLGLLGYLLRKAQQASAAIHFVAAARPVTPPAPLALLLETLMRTDQLARLTLPRLTPGDIARLAQQMSPTAAKLADWLNTLSEGNPFILGELIRYARAHQLLANDGHLNLTSTAAQIVPHTVYTLIRTRLARLSEAARQVLNTATVIGREFEVDVVARTVALSDAAVLDSLDELQRAGLIQPLAGLRYQFDHYLTMQVAYQEMGEPRHRLLHRRVAEALESLYRHRLDNVAGLLAHHFAEGRVPERAAPYALRAGQQAAKLAAWHEATAFYEQALSLCEVLPEPSLRQSVLLALGQAGLQAGQYGRAADALRLALQLVPACARPVDTDILYVNLLEALLFATRYTELIAVADEIHAIHRMQAASNVEFYRGVALAQIGIDLDGAIAHLQKAEVLLSRPDALVARPVTGVVTLGEIKLELGNIFARRGALATAVAYFRAGIAITQSRETGRTLRVNILCYNNLAYHLHLQNDGTAANYAQTGLALAHENGALLLLPYLYSTLGEIALAQRDVAAAEHNFTEGLVLARQFSALERIAGLTANLGLVAQARGDQPSAIEQLAAALAQAETLQLRFLAAQIHLWLAPLLPIREAQTHLASARLLATEDGYHGLLAEAASLEAALGEANNPQML